MADHLVPRQKPKSGIHEKKKKEDGMKQSQKLLLTWLIEDTRLFSVIGRYITPEDFSEEIYRKVAAELYAQFETDGEVNPAKIISMFQSEEEQREIASLFHAHIEHLETKDSIEKALKETIVRIKRNRIDYRSKNLNPTDLLGLQKLLEDRRKLEQLEKLHISIE